MYWLKKMVETVRTEREPFAGIDIPTYEGKYRKAGKNELEHFFGLITRAHPFVFERPIKYDYAAWLDDVKKQSELGQDQEKLYPGLDSAPFGVFSIECINGPIVSPNDNLCKWPILCVLCYESAPMEFSYYDLMQSSSAGRYWVSKTGVMARPVELYLEKLKNSLVGREKTREIIKIGSGSSKRIHEINTVIRVCDKREKDGLKPVFSRGIDWTHRWFTRGHWRKKLGIGKDRNGDYCIKDFTWVKEHLKGPEGMPVIKKTYLIEQKGQQ